MSEQKKTVAFHTLGCKLNFSETSTLSRMMEKEGFESRRFDEAADVYVINTCSVTENADRECRHLVRRVLRQSPESMVVITGCYAQLKPREIAEIPGVDLVLGASEKFNLPRHIAELSSAQVTRISSCDIEQLSGFNSSFSAEGRTRSFLKVQDGCDYNCSFCTIPMARGKSRSDTISNVIANVRQLAENNIREVVLTGVNLGDFGKGADGGKQHAENFFELITQLDTINGIDRYRISSIEPNLLTNDIIAFVAESRKFMPHFHIPLQSGSNALLAAMRRRYRKELYAERVSLIKTLMPHGCIGADVIVGFPGEGEQEFAETIEFLDGLDLSYLHVFTYSERANTHALNLEAVVPVHVRHERNKVLRSMSYRKNAAFAASFAGTSRKVLFESRRENGMMDGYTDNYIKVSTPFRAAWHNQIIDWTL